MKKKNHTMRIAAGVMTAALLSTCAISSTFAKYTSESTGTATARVAKWDILFGEGETTMNKTFTFDLYSTLYDTTANNAETDVKTGDDVTRIAPGTQGSFAVKITNNSEVTAKYTVSFTIGYTDNTANTEVKSVTIPLRFSTDGSDWKTSIEDLNIDDTAAVALGMTDRDKLATYTVFWKWDYEDTTDNNRDKNDTILGTAGAEIQITATVTATQVN